MTHSGHNPNPQNFHCPRQRPPRWAANLPHDNRHLRSDDVLQLIADLFADWEPPGHIRPDNGPELTANGMRSLFSRIGVQALFIDLGRTWKDGYNESFTVKLRDALLNRGNILHAK